LPQNQASNGEKQKGAKHQKAQHFTYCDGLPGSPGNGTRFAFFSELLNDCALSLQQNHTCMQVEQVKPH